MPVMDAEKTVLEVQTTVQGGGDWEVVERAEDRLRNSAYQELRSVFCSYRGGILTLRGRVPSFYLKQLAQTLLTGLDSVEHLNNQVEVLE
jgi:hypothetical protein